MMKNYISKMQQDICSVRNAVPRTNFSEDHLVKPKGIKNGIVATPPFLVSLFLVPDVCQLQDHASPNPVVMVCSCLEITKQEHHTYDPQEHNPMDHTFMVHLDTRASRQPQHPWLLRRHCPCWMAQSWRRTRSS